LIELWSLNKLWKNFFIVSWFYINKYLLRCNCHYNCTCISTWTPWPCICSCT
jgi:hypothetical protein